MKKTLKILLYIVIVLAIGFVILVGYATISDYQPDEKTNVYQSENPEVLEDSLEYVFMIWNIGYCGLSQEMDFFYDGGKMVKAEKKQVETNLKEINAYLTKEEDIDFFLLQEVDKDSKRSYGTNQYETFEKSLSRYTSFFGKNYDVFFVPLPITNPYGRVLSGLMTLSLYRPLSSDRYSFPGNYGWPKGLFMLDRCFLVNRYPLKSGKEILVINTHNSAYDDGSLKKGQMDYLKNFLLKEYEKGNYIVAGGDWNQCPPNLEPKIEGYIFDEETFDLIDENYLPADWKWAYQTKVPTNRRVATPYNKKTSKTTMIDFYLLSPNIEVINIEGVNYEFKNSDHQPVKLSIKLKK